MTRPEQKKEEKEVFLDFVKRSGLPIDKKTIDYGDDAKNEPDMKCRVGEDAYVAFELKEICDEEIAEWIAHLHKKLKKDQPAEPTFKCLNDMRTMSENFVAFLKEICTKRYQTNYPVELLLYTSRTTLTDDVIIDDIDNQSNSLKLQFRKVWLMTEDVCGCVIPNRIPRDDSKKYCFSAKQDGNPAICTREEFNSPKDAKKYGKKFVEANPEMFPPEKGEVQISWHVAGDG